MGFRFACKFMMRVDPPETAAADAATGDAEAPTPPAPKLEDKPEDASAS
jgi:hypothetical protein